MGSNLEGSTVLFSPFIDSAFIAQKAASVHFGLGCSQRPSFLMPQEIFIDALNQHFWVQPHPSYAFQASIFAQVLFAD